MPTSFCPRGLLRWLGAFALGAAPFAGFYLYTKFYGFITRALRFKIHRLLPRPYNAHKQQQFGEGTQGPPGPGFVPIGLETDESSEPVNSSPTTTRDPDSGALHRRQSTLSLRGSGSGNTTGQQSLPSPGPGPSPGYSQDDFASEDEEAEVISATLISFDVEAAEPLPESSSDNAGGNNNSNNNNPVAWNANGDTTPGVWSAELRPNAVDYSRVLRDYPEHVYRENVLTRLPAILATDVLAITPARLLMTPFAAAVWLGLARPYMARMGRGLEDVVRGAGWWWGLYSGRALVNLLGLELLLAVMHGEAWALVMLVAERFRYSEEEWYVTSAAVHIYNPFRGAVS